MLNKLEKLKNLFSKKTSSETNSDINSSKLPVSNTVNNAIQIDNEDNSLNNENQNLPSVDNQHISKHESELKENKHKAGTFEQKIETAKRKQKWIKNIEKKLDVEIKKDNTKSIQGKQESEVYNKDFSYSGETIHFGCTQCGKCCNVPPKVEFNELFRLKDEFIFQTNHTCFLSYNKNPLPKEITDFYNGIGHTIVLTDLEAVMFYFIEFTPMINPSYKQCPKLVDNKCSIYENRPHSCELYPFSKSYEQEEQWRSIQFFRKKTDEGIYQCDFSEKSPIIYDNHMFSNYSLENRFEKSISDIHNFTNHYISFLESISKDYKNSHFKYLVNAISQNSLFISDTLNPMLSGVLNNLITKKDAEEFVKSQIKLIEKEIQSSQLNKNKENLHTSRLYTKQRSMFEKALLTDMFDVSKYNKSN